MKKDINLSSFINFSKKKEESNKEYQEDISV